MFRRIIRWLYFIRSYDGSCNNLAYPNWGRSNSPMERILPPQYADGIWAAREWPGLPPVDAVSRTVQDIDLPDHQLTITVMHWGQFVAHDVTHVPTYRTRKQLACLSGILTVGRFDSFIGICSEQLSNSMLHWRRQVLVA